jgi:hypothetical protein
MVVWFWITGVSALSIITILVILLFKSAPLKNRREADIPLPRPFRVQSVPDASTENRPLSPAARTRQNSIPPAITPKLTEKFAKKAVPPPVQTSPAGQFKSDDFVNRQSGQEENRFDSERKSLQPALPVQSTTLTLSGIAWNNDSADRLAIINGQPTATGAVVGGVVIEEIMPDRVKVTNNGRSFEIILGKTAKSE